MNKNFIKYGNKVYVLDINKIVKWVLSSPSSTNQLKETEINEGYDTNDNGDLTMVTKVVRELKSNNDQNDTVRYDFIKFLITPLLEISKETNNIRDNFSNTLLFNTLLEMEFLKEIID